MSDANDNNGNGQGNGSGGRAPLTLKPRAGGSVSAGTVRQSFSHGRSKTVVVETKRRRVEGPGAAPNLAAPSAAERRPAEPQRPAPNPQQSRPADPTGRLSAEEQAARQRAIELARREQERRDAERRAQEAQRRAEEDARRREAEARAAQAAPTPAPTPAPAPTPQPAAPQAPAQASAPQPAAPPARAPQAPQAPAERPTAEARPAQPERPQPSYGQRSFNERAPRPESGYGQRAPRPDAPRPGGGYGDRDRAPRPEGGQGYGQRPGGFPDRGPRPEGQGGYAARGPRPEGGQGYAPRPGGYGDRGPRPEGQGGYGQREGYRGGGDRPREGGGGFGDRGPRPPRPGGAPGETVRYSALSPRPAPGGDRGPRGPGGPRGPAAGAPPAAPEVSRPSRSIGARGPDRRPSDEDDRRRGPGGPKTADAGKALSRTKGEPSRRQGRLTIQAVAGDGDTAERMRSLASVRRAREREKEKRRGGAVDQPRVSREVVIPDVITVQELANRMATRGVEIIKFMMRQGMMLKINDVIDSDTAELVATEFGHTVKRVSESDVEEGFLAADDDEGDTLPRPPVVAVMGHVDHGKTSLLDALRTTDVAAGEAGGITQHIGAYQVHLADGQRVTFLDTPGHAAFSAMRARGADVTDIVVLVVAADDGVMPQTAEAISHAKAAGAPIIVAVNKIDKPDANPTRVVNELLQHEIVAESLGGETQIIEVSATKRINLEGLIEAILLQAEVMDLRANPDRTAEGSVIEAKLDKGRGAVATVLVNRGTLKRGDIVVAGSSWGRVRALVNERGEQVQSAGPSEPVEILGLDAAPSPGDALAVVEDEARARELTEYRARVRREKSAAPSLAGASLADMMARLQDKKVSELPVIIKADVQGSAEAIASSLAKLGTEEVRARVIHSGVGGINESDVLLAKGSGAPIIGFNVRASKQARDLAEREGVEIRYYAVIYDLIDDIKSVMSGMLSPDLRETYLGMATVLEVFDITKVGKVAGCRVNDGVVRRGAKVRIIRDDVVIQEMGTLQTLKRFKDDVAEVTNGMECGMSFANFQDIKPGDQIECFTVESVARSL